MTTLEKLNNEISNVELGVEILKLIHSISLSELSKNDKALAAVMNILEKLQQTKGI